MNTAVCCRVKAPFEDYGLPRAMAEMDEWDRCRWHPCTKLKRVPGCRGQVSLRGKFWGKTAFLTWVPRGDLVHAPKYYLDLVGRMLRRFPHLCITHTWLQRESGLWVIAHCLERPE